MTSPKLGTIRRYGGVAGQFSYSVDVTYPDEPTSRVEFVGSIYGAPIVMVRGRHQQVVFDSGRFGKFSPEWVRRFFGEE